MQKGELLIMLDSNSQENPTVEDQIEVVDTTAVRLGHLKSVSEQFRDQNHLRKQYRINKNQRRNEKKMNSREAVEIPSHTLFEWIDRELRKTHIEDIILINKDDLVGTKEEEYPCSQQFLHLTQKFSLGTHFKYRYIDKKTGNTKWVVKFWLEPKEMGEYKIRVHTTVL